MGDWGQGPGGAGQGGLAVTLEMSSSAACHIGLHPLVGFPNVQSWALWCAPMQECTAVGRGQGQEGGGQGAGIEGASRTGKTRRAISLLFFDKAPCDIVAIAKIDIHVDFPEIH